MLEELARHGVVAVRDHPHQRRSLYADPGLVRLHPGIVAVADRADDPTVRLRGSLLAAPDGVVVGEAALALAWPDSFALPRRPTLAVASGRRPGPLFDTIRAHLPPELVTHRLGIPALAPAAAAVYSAAFDDGRGIDTALRHRIPLGHLQAAARAFDHWPGDSTRRAVLRDSRDLPWSHLERTGHRWLREAGFTGWRANLRVVIDGETLYLDIGFPRLRLACEFDSVTYHLNAIAFERDRYRLAALVTAGWAVLPITGSQLDADRDRLTRQLACTIEDRTRQFGLPRAEFRRPLHNRAAEARRSPRHGGEGSRRES